MQPSRSMASGRAVATALALGTFVLAAGWLLARRVLPEWRLGPLPEQARIETRFRDLLAANGLPPAPETVSFRLATDARVIPYAFANLGPRAGDWLVDSGCALPIEASARVAAGPAAGASMMTVELCGDLRILLAQSMAENWFQQAGRPFLDSPVRTLVRDLVVPAGTDLGEPHRVLIANSEGVVYAMPPSIATTVPEFLQLVTYPGPGAAANRLPGTPEQAAARSHQFSWSSLVLQTLPGVLLVVGVGALFVALVLRRHVDYLNALLLAALALAGTAGSLGEASSGGGLLSAAVLVVVWLGRALALFILWTAAESWLRSTLPGFTTSLDAVRAGRLGPRAGRAILGGWGIGAGLAGLQLLLFSAAVASGWAHPKESSVGLGVFAGASPFFVAPLRAGLVVLAIACGRRLLRARWAPWAAIGFAALLQQMPGLEPWPARLGASVVTAAVLVFAHQQFGLTALLAATLNAACAPLVLLGLQQPEWLAGGLVLCGATSLALLLVGSVASSLKHDPAGERPAVPRFVRRLEDERRMRYEMDLLTRMQLGLLPASLPEVPGWSIAARSLLANEVGGDLYDFVWDERGRLWIAAGDVSGHGFSCAVTQAMTKAALVSLVYSGTTPSEVLLEIDRVLRTAGDVRNFASLALLRLDPANGEGVFANAGHPYPLVRRASGVHEVALPGLPLGRGPARAYADVPLTLAPGESLVFASDGLFEAQGNDDEPYGYLRAREVLTSGVGVTATDIAERLLADWTRFRGGLEPTDDTTLVVLRRHDPE